MRRLSLAVAGPRCAGFPCCRAWTSAVAAHGLGLSLSMWGLPRPGTKPISLGLAGGFLTTGPPGRSPPTLKTRPLSTLNYLSFFESLRLSLTGSGTQLLLFIGFRAWWRQVIPLLHGPLEEVGKQAQSCTSWWRGEHLSAIAALQVKVLR